MRFARLLPLLVAVSVAVLTTRPAEARTLYLNHFDRSLDADHSLYGQPKATVRGLALSKPGLGYPYGTGATGRALDAGYSKPDAPDAMVSYAGANVDSRRGTIEMWVKPAWGADPPRTRTTDRFHHFLAVPLENKGSLSLYYACYRHNTFTPYIAFHINNGRKDGDQGPDYIVNFRLSPDEKGRGLTWQKDTWHHLVAMWTPAELCLYADGKRVGRRRFERPFDIPMVAGPVVLGNNSAGCWGPPHSPAGALIDEVRISDAPLYEGLDTVPVPTTPLSAADDAPVIGAGGPTVIRQPDPRRYFCYRTDAPPVIDGKLDDAVWRRVPAFSGFLVYGKVDEYSPFQTEARLCRDDKHVYLGVLLYESHLDKLKADAKPDATGKEDPGAFGDDSLEVFLGVKRGELPNVQIAVNSVNQRCDIMHQKRKADVQWNGTFRTSTGRTADGWVVEMAFPYADLGAAPHVGDIWGLRVARNRRVAGIDLSAVNYACMAYQRPDQFARLIMAGTLPALDVVKQENLLHQDYVANCRAVLTEFVRESRTQLGFAARMGEPIKAQFGLPKLEGQIKASLGQIQELAETRTAQPVARWNRARLRIGGEAAVLERFGYLLACAGGARAVLPPASVRGVARVGTTWYLASDQIAAAIEPDHGMVAGIWDRTTGRRLVVSGYLVYQARTRTAEVNTDERRDQVTRARMDGPRLVVECRNPMLPGVQLRKHYYLEQAEGQSRLVCRRLEIAGEVTETTLVKVTSRTLFDADYRRTSFYNRIYVIGTMGDGRGYVSAGDVTGRVLQRAWFNSEEGRAQFALVNPADGTGIGEYLYKENDQWAFPQALPSSYWTPFGWDMGFAAVFVGDKAYRGKAYSAELRYHLFRGDRLTFHREYLRLPEFAAVMAASPPSPKADRIGGYLDIQAAQAVGNAPRTVKARENRAGKARQALYRPDELTFVTSVVWDGRWPDYATGDDQEIIKPHNTKPGVVSRRHKAVDIRKSLDVIRKLNPNSLSMSYHFITDIYKGSRTLKDHPDWACIGRDGQPVRGYFGDVYVRANWCRPFVDHLIAGLLRTADYFGMDVCYLDYNAGTILPDWGRGHVVTLAEYLDFQRRLQIALHKRGKLLWLNAYTGQPYFDIGYWEGLGSPRWGKTWRDQAEQYMMSKVYLAPGCLRVPLYWLGGDMFRDRGAANEVYYLDKTLASGLTPTGCYLDPYHKHFPSPELSGAADWVAITKYQIAVHHASLEMRDSAWADVGLEPSWLTDPKCSLEAYTLRVPHPRGGPRSADGTSYLVNVLSHQRKSADTTISVDLEAMGFDPAKRTFVWQLLRRDYDKFPKRNPVPPNWQQLFSSRLCSSVVPNSARLRYTIRRLPPQRLCVTAITQTPGAVASVAGIDTQTLLPTALRCRITGSADERARTVTLRVTSDRDVEVIAWWPKAWGAPAATVAGKPTAGTPVSFGSEQFVRFAVPKGNRDVRIGTK